MIRGSNQHLFFAVHSSFQLCFDTLSKKGYIMKMYAFGANKNGILFIIWHISWVNTQTSNLWLYFLMLTVLLSTITESACMHIFFIQLQTVSNKVSRNEMVIAVQIDNSISTSMIMKLSTYYAYFEINQIMM